MPLKAPTREENAQKQIQPELGKEAPVYLRSKEVNISEIRDIPQNRYDNRHYRKDGHRIRRQLFVIGYSFEQRIKGKEHNDKH